MSDLRMPDTNHIMIAGRLTRDPELRYTAGGIAVCNFSIANTRHYKKDGEKMEETTFINCVCFKKSAEYVGKAVKKGRPAMVEGRLKSEKWQDKSTGQERTGFKLQAQRVTPLDWDESGNSQHGGGQAQQSQQGAPQGQQSQPVDQSIPEDDIPF